MDAKSARTGARMGIRKPVAEVFRAFTDPAVTTKFWFTKSSGKLAPGAKVKWEWEMFGVSDTAIVKAIESNKRIIVAFADGGTTAEWTFEPVSAHHTFVTVTHTGFSAEGDELVATMLGDTEGWTLVLAGAKAWLEHGIQLNLVADHSPAILRMDSASPPPTTR